MVMTKKADCDIDRVHTLLTKYVPDAIMEGKRKVLLITLLSLLLDYNLVFTLVLGLLL